MLQRNPCWPETLVKENAQPAFFQNLLDRRFQLYFEAVIVGNPLWLFVHVPKTAGSSFNGELMSVLLPNHHILVDYTQLDHRPFNAMLDEAVDQFIAKAQQQRFQYATGHITAGHVSKIADSLPEVQPITLLRDPVARVVSDYRYQCSAQHPGHQDFKARHPHIDSYLDIATEWNKFSTHLVPENLRGVDRAGLAIDYILQRYAFIGIQEQYDLSLRLITTLIGAPTRPKIFKRVNTPTPETEIQLTQEQESRIRQSNAADIVIYEAIASQFNAIAGDLMEYLDVVDPLPPA